MILILPKKLSRRSEQGFNKSRRRHGERAKLETVRLPGTVFGSTVFEKLRQIRIQRGVDNQDVHR